MRLHYTRLYIFMRNMGQKFECVVQVHFRIYFMQFNLRSNILALHRRTMKLSDELIATN